MTIGTPKLTTPAYWSSGTGTVALPTGIAAGDVIAEGEAEVSLPTDAGQNKRLAMLSPGMSFGEMALLNHRTRSADVTATCQSKFYQVAFDEIPDDVRVTFVTNIAEQLARKLGRETREMKHLD